MKENNVSRKKMERRAFLKLTGVTAGTALAGSFGLFKPEVMEANDLSTLGGNKGGIHIITVGPPDPTINNYQVKINDAIKKATEMGGNVYLMPGIYKINDEIKIDFSDINFSDYINNQTTHRTAIQGMGAHSTIIKWVGVDDPQKGCIHYIGRKKEDTDGNQKPEMRIFLRDLTIIAGKASNKDKVNGIIMEGAAEVFVDNVFTHRGYRGLWNKEGIIMSYTNCHFRDAEVGIYSNFEKEYQRPNALYFTNVVVKNNTKVGAQFDWGTSINWIGGTVENNGSGSISKVYKEIQGGIKFQKLGEQEGMGVNIYNLWFEHNRGLADIYGQDPRADDTIINIAGCNFLRSHHFSSEGEGHNDTVLNNICIRGKYLLSVNGCSFSTNWDYRPSVERRFITTEINKTKYRTFGNNRQDQDAGRISWLNKATFESLNICDLPFSPDGLEKGDIYCDGQGNLKIKI